MCAPGWTIYSNSLFCYKYFDERKSWEDARRSCQTDAPLKGCKGTGDLASVENNDTNLFLASLPPQPLSGFIFLGGAREHGTGQFGWTDGTPWNFESWDVSKENQHEPDNGTYHGSGQGPESHMVLGWGNGWHDIPNDIDGHYICQYQGDQNR